MTKTFAIIKPDAVRAGTMSSILRRIEDNFKITKMVMKHMTKEEAEGFYAEHKERPFFGGLTDFMSSGPCVLLELTGGTDDTVPRWRELMGATNPAEAGDNTIRAIYGKSIDNNAVHGSDSNESAERELDYWFKPLVKISGQ